MITFAFTVLALILFAIAGVFAYLYAKREFKTALNAHLVHARAKIRAVDAKSKRYYLEIKDDLNVTNQTLQELSLHIRKDSTVPTAGTMRPFARTEDRYEEQFGNVVVIDGKRVPVPQKTG